MLLRWKVENETIPERKSKIKNKDKKSNSRVVFEVSSTSFNLCSCFEFCLTEHKDAMNSPSDPRVVSKKHKSTAGRSLETIERRYLSNFAISILVKTIIPPKHEKKRDETDEELRACNVPRIQLGNPNFSNAKKGIQCFFPSHQAGMSVRVGASLQKTGGAIGIRDNRQLFWATYFEDVQTGFFFCAKAPQPPTNRGLFSLFRSTFCAMSCSAAGARPDERDLGPTELALRGNGNFFASVPTPPPPPKKISAELGKRASQSAR